MSSICIRHLGRHGATLSGGRAQTSQRHEVCNALPTPQRQRETHVKAMPGTYIGGMRAVTKCVHILGRPRAPSPGPGPLAALQAFVVARVDDWARGSALVCARSGLLRRVRFTSISCAAKTAPRTNAYDQDRHRIGAGSRIDMHTCAYGHVCKVGPAKNAALRSFTLAAAVFRKSILPRAWPYVNRIYPVRGRTHRAWSYARRVRTVRGRAHINFA